jgi:hypothetical protein
LYTNRERARDLFLKALQDFTQRGAQVCLSLYLFRSSLLSLVFPSALSFCFSVFINCVQIFEFSFFQAAFDPNAYRLQLSTLVKAFFATLAPANFMYYSLYQLISILFLFD